ncbi:MAG: M13 family metallopeptidase [Kofleriaceae bacterium]
MASILFVVASCGSKTSPTPSSPTWESQPHATADADTPPAPSKPVTNRSLASTGLDPEALDRTADPCEDFYQFACGGWMAKTEIPADKPLAMRSFVSIEDRNVDYEHGVLEQMRTKPGNDPLAAKLGAYYGACMDEPAIEKMGTRPIASLLNVVNKVSNTKTLSNAIAQLHAAGFGVVFKLRPTQDSKDAKQVIAEIEQGGIGLPDRDYYLNDDAASKDLRAKYQAYVAAMLTELGHKVYAKEEAAQILALETAIAKVSKDKVARRDPKGTYNRLEREGVAKAMSHFGWDAYWTTVGLPKVSAVTVTSPEFLAGIDPLLTSTPPDVWRAYLTFHLGNQAATLLTKRIEDTQFKFYSALTGQPEMEPRWKRCVGHTDEALGDLLGQVFVRDRFAGASKAAAEQQVQAIVNAMTLNLAALPWMDAQTKVKAKAKLDAMTYQIGYPNKWRSYSFKIDAKSWGANALAARKAETARKLAKIGKPLDRDDWEMSAPTVNAYYNPSLNGMVFPAGILQPPFYSVDAAIPVNLGAMGMVVGHELTHGFDDQGAQYDAAGNLVNWWAPETEKQFKQRTQCVIDQYNQYEAAGGTKLNGANTLGENIADIGGVKLAFAGYRSLRASSPDTVVADGFTEDQQFFLGFGQAWCAKMRPDYEKLLATVDVHSPARWRVNGTVSATPEFAKAFSCKAKQKMVPAKQCVVW